MAIGASYGAMALGVGFTVLGLIIALALNAKFPGRALLRASVLVPWAIPTVVSSRLWGLIFNTDFGLINRILGTEINWFGTTASSMFAILLVQLWLGYNYMFLVITGALQSIPGELVEAARVDGGGPLAIFRRISSL